MMVFRWIIALVLGAFVWAYYRVRTGNDSTSYTGQGSIADASTRQETAFRAQLAGLRERYAEEAGWRAQFTTPEVDDANVLTNYVTVNDPCSPEGATGVSFINGQDTTVTCRRDALSSVARWSF